MAYFNTYFRINAGYQWGSGLSKEKTLAFYKEIREVFAARGWTIAEHKPYDTIDVIKGKTRLYVHPMELTGPCETELVPVVEEILHECKTFTYEQTKIYNELADLDPEMLTEYYRSKNTETDSLILSTFKTKRKNLGYFISTTLFNLGDKIRLETIYDHGGRGSGDTTDKYLHERFDALVQKGLITVFQSNTNLARTA